MMLDMEEILPGHDLSWMGRDKQQRYSEIATVLGHVYAQVEWRKVSGTKVATDVFEHRIKNSASRPTFSEFVSKLCNQLGIQALHMRPGIMVEAMRQGDALLRIIRRESQLCVMLAKTAAKHIRETRRR